MYYDQALIDRTPSNSPEDDAKRIVRSNTKEWYEAHNEQHKFELETLGGFAKGFASQAFLLALEEYVAWYVEAHR